MQPDSLKIKNGYAKRSVRFLELYHYSDRHIKIYSISYSKEKVSTELVEYAKKKIPEWAKNKIHSGCNVHKYSTLILHEGNGITFAVFNSWVDENVLQQFVYKVTDDKYFELYSDKGIFCCVWELEIIMFERNAWVKYILSHPENPQIKEYLSAQLNGEV